MSYPNQPPPAARPHSAVDDPQGYQRRQDQEHLLLLSAFHYVLGALTALGSCFFLIYVVMGVVILTHPSALAEPGRAAADAPPAFLGWMLALLGGGATAAGWTYGGLTAYAGTCLRKHKSLTLIQIIAGLNCIQVPLGTALGVFTLVVLNRPSVREFFAPREPVSRYGALMDPAPDR